jgi:hypothetical protein
MRNDRVRNILESIAKINEASKDIKTFKLKGIRFNGVEVLAKDNGVDPYMYTNYKQANEKQQELKLMGIDCELIGERPIYIKINKKY